MQRDETPAEPDPPAVDWWTPLIADPDDAEDVGAAGTPPDEPRDMPPSEVPRTCRPFKD